MTPKMGEIAGELDQARQALLESVAGLSQEEYDARPAGGGWSVGEVLHHVVLIEQGVARLVAGALDKALEAGLAPDASPEASVLDAAAHFPVEDRSTRREAPSFVHPTHGLSREEIGQALSAAREALREAMSRGSAYDLGGVAVPHPLFGPLTLYQWLLVTAAHERRHTAQIRELREALPSPAPA